MRVKLGKKPQSGYKMSKFGCFLDGIFDIIKGKRLKLGETFMQLKDLYEKIENPLNNDNNIMDMIDIYKNSCRTSHNFESVNVKIAPHSVYDGITRPTRVDDSNYLDDDRETFLIDMYNSWIKNMLALSKEDRKKVNEEYKDLDGLIARLGTVREVRSVSDIEKLRDCPNDVFSTDDIEYWQGKAFDHIQSSKITGYKQAIDLDDISHRIYIGAKREDIYALAYEFRKACEEENLPYYFKFDIGKQSRVDTVVVYSDNENFGKYIDILEKIKEKRPEIAKKCGKPSIVMGNYDNWLGMADEPQITYMVDGRSRTASYNEIRAVLIEEAMDRVMTRRMRELSENNTSFDVSSAFKNSLSQVIVYETFANNPNLDENQRQILREEIKNFCENIAEEESSELIDYFANSCDRRWKEDIDECQEDEILNLKKNIVCGKDSLECKITLATLDLAIKGMVDDVIANTTDFVALARKELERACKKHRIDGDKFVFNESTKEMVMGSEDEMDDDIKIFNKDDFMSFLKKKKENKEEKQSNEQSQINTSENISDRTDDGYSDGM